MFALLYTLHHTQTFLNSLSSHTRFYLPFPYKEYATMAKNKQKVLHWSLDLRKTLGSVPFLRSCGSKTSNFFRGVCPAVEGIFVFHFLRSRLYCILIRRQYPAPRHSVLSVASRVDYTVASYRCSNSAPTVQETNTKCIFFHSHETF